MGTGKGLTALALVAALTAASPARDRGTVAGLDEALDRLAREAQFSGAVVVRGPEGVRFASGYGWADPFARRPFRPETPADSASLAKPVTAAAVLLLVRDGRVVLDAPVQRYLPEYPDAGATVRHLLSHAAGLRDEAAQQITGRTNAQLLAEVGNASRRHAPGSAFTYCNTCYSTLAMLIGMPYLTFVRNRAALPPAVSLRPARLADWNERAIGYRISNGRFDRADSYEGELFYGSANFSISALQLAWWGTQWWGPQLASIQTLATAPVTIAGNRSGLTLGSWYCAPTGRRCHYLGHHEGFHHMLYWDADRRISVAMMSNNSLAPGLQQPLQRALVAFAEGSAARARRELASVLAEEEAPVGRFTLSSGETVEVIAQGDQRSVRRRGLDYPAYKIGSGIRYVPGLDLYVAGTGAGGLRWLTLYEDLQGLPATRS
jgi:CubicO group peptidase (beta-lactamase class C family)